LKPRLFTIKEINKIIPELDEIVARLFKKREKMQQKHDQLMVLELIDEEKIQDLTTPEGKEYVAKAAELESLILSIEDDLTEISGLGGTLRDLETGSIDFYSIIRSELVYLNWQRGEHQISYYHPFHIPHTERKLLNN